MIPPPKPHLPSLNPRELLAAGGVDRVAEALASTGYMIQRQLLSDLIQALRSGRPLLIEGEAGAGKTALAYALYEACNLTLFPLQGMAELRLADILYEWDREAQNQWVIQATASGATTLEAAQEAQYTMRFLKLGEALNAYHWAAQTGSVPLFLFDEVDKLPEHLQDMLLQLCECSFAHVPRFNLPVGIYDAETGATDRTRHPVVIFTSNNLRHKLSEPFRSRCYYSWLDSPTPSEEVKILRRRVPDASPQLVTAVVKINECIKMIPSVQKKPGLRELIDLLAALVRDRVPRVNEAVLHDYVGYLAKQKSHIKSLREALARVERHLEIEDRRVDGWVAEAFAIDGAVLEMAA